MESTKSFPENLDTYNIKASYSDGEGQHERSVTITLMRKDRMPKNMYFHIKVKKFSKHQGIIREEKEISDLNAENFSKDHLDYIAKRTMEWLTVDGKDLTYEYKRLAMYQDWKSPKHAKCSVEANLLLWKCRYCK